MQGLFPSRARKLPSGYAHFGVFALILVLLAVADAKKPKWNNVRNLRKVKFKLDKKRSDEFSGKSLNRYKWNPNGLQNGNTGCPKWNGPVDWKRPKFSTYHETTTGLNGKQSNPKTRNYRVSRGSLLLRVTTKPKSYFKKREYYCDKKKFHCNHNKKIPCFGTTYDGYPILKNKNKPKSYKYVVHDKCKIEPYCIPSPKHITGAGRKYQKYLGVNIVGRRLFKYGFFEARVRISRSSVVTAVWMFDDNMKPGYNRWVYDSDNKYYRFESPTAIRSRRWQEIDMLEAMNAERDGLKRQYIPNIHVFAGYKGEFTQRNLKRGRLGPIILDRDVFTQRNPKFSPPDPERTNDFHLNYGNTRSLSRDWASGWRTVGMYWSPREIRFLLDGEETLRLKNKLVHQSMFWSIGTGLNREWAGRRPRQSELGRWSQIDYVRRWTVKTKGGYDPPSKLPINKAMETNFKSYGNKYLAVDGVFPVKDDGESIPDPAVRFFSGMLSQISGDKGGFSSILQKQPESPAPIAATNAPSVMQNPVPADPTPVNSALVPQTPFLSSIFSGANNADTPTVDIEQPGTNTEVPETDTEEPETDPEEPTFDFDIPFTDPEPDTDTSVEESDNEPELPQGDSSNPLEGVDNLPDMPFSFWENAMNGMEDQDEFLPAGGLGNQLLSEITGFTPAFSLREQLLLTSREDRLRDVDEEPVCDKDGARTAFEDVNPETNLAGWATMGGTGENAGVIPKEQCA